MRDWEEKDLQFILDKKYFPECVDCGQTYFHKRSCSSVTGIVDDMSIINERLNKRLEEFEKKHGVNGCGIECNECSNIAVGTMHVFFHNTQKTAEDWPVCMDHAFHEDSAGRECQFKGF